MAPRKKIKSKAPTEISALDNYLLMLILLRLPVKFQHKIKCVSKLWNALITSAFPPQKLGTNSGFLAFDLQGACTGYFPRFHQLFAPRHDYAVRFDLTQALLPSDPSLKILTTQNGLLLCIKEHDQWLNLYVCNSLTKQIYEVPMPEAAHGTTSNFIALEFDPNISLRYKIIRSLRTCCDPSVKGAVPGFPYLELEIFSSESQKWGRKSLFHGPHGACLPGNVLLLTGTMYKLVAPNHVVGFGFEDRLPKGRTLVSTLPVESGFSGTGCIATWGGWLHYTSWDGVFLKIWRVRNFKRSVWEVMHVNSMAIMRGIVARDISHNVSREAVFYLAGYAPDFKLLFLDNNGRVLGYDFPSSTMQKLSGLLPRTAEKGFKLLPFLPSLFNPSKIPEALTSSSQIMI